MQAKRSLLIVFSLAMSFPVFSCFAIATEKLCPGYLTSGEDQKESPSSTKTARQKAIELADQIRIDASMRKDQRLEARDLGGWLQAEAEFMSAYDSRNFEWIFNMEKFENFSLADNNVTAYGENNTSRFQKEARVAYEMYSAVSQQPMQESEVRFVLKRFRDSGDSRSWSYRVLAIFPEYPFRYFRNRPPNVATYFSVCNACVNHAADLLYKKMGNGNVGSISAQALDQILIGFQEDTVPESATVMEFADPNLGQRDPFTYLFAAATGQFSNERKRYEIPLQLLQKPPQ